MRSPTTWPLLLQVEFARCRMRPVVGRLPLLGAGAAAAIAAVGHPAGDSLTGAQVAGAISLGATPGVLVAYAVGAMVGHDSKTSGTDATDRALVARPLALGAAQAVAAASWVATVAATVALALGLTVIGAGQVRGHPLPPASDLWPALVGVARFATASAAAAAAGLTVAKLARSAAAAIGGFLVLLLIGDGALLALHPDLALLALPDNLLALGSGELEGLAVRGESPTGTAIRAVLGAAVLAAVGMAVDARRDLL